MAATQVVFVYQQVAPFALLATIITDDDDHPGVPVHQRPECNAANYGPGPTAAIVLPIKTYNNLTVPIERDATLVTAIWATEAPGQPVPPSLIGPPVVTPPSQTGAPSNGVSL